MTGNLKNFAKFFWTNKALELYWGRKDAKGKRKSQNLGFGRSVRGSPSLRSQETFFSASQCPLSHATTVTCQWLYTRPMTVLVLHVRNLRLLPIACKSARPVPSTESNSMVNLINEQCIRVREMLIIELSNWLWPYLVFKKILPKILYSSPDRILWHIHRVLNIDKNKN